MRAAAGAGAETRTGTSSSELSPSSALKGWDKCGAPVGNPVPEHPRVTPGMGWGQGQGSGSTLRAVLWGLLPYGSCGLPAASLHRRRLWKLEQAQDGACPGTQWGQAGTGTSRRSPTQGTQALEPQQPWFGHHKAPGVLHGTTTQSRVNHCHD